MSAFMKIGNTFIKLFLRSPLHRMMSKSTLLITFTGRKSGNKYTTPVNYSLEGKDGDNFVNLKIGAEQTLGSNFSLIIEYDFAFNDNNSPGFGEDKGYLNIGLRWTVSNGFTLGFDLRDLRSNKSGTNNSFDRAMRIEYIQSIF